MNYWYSVLGKNGETYSCDMIRIGFVHREDSIDSLLNFLGSYERMDIECFPLCTQEHKYRYLFVIDYGSGKMSVGIGFNGNVAEDMKKGFIEFNPNKCLENPQCSKDIGIIRMSCWKFDIVRWDLAIDISVARKYVHLRKDNRKYEQHCHSRDDLTEYLGTRNNVGRFKLYNKTLESGLDEDVTRLELTLGDLKSSFRDARDCLPVVWVNVPQHDMMLDTGLKGNALVLLELLRSVDDPDYYFRKLSYHVRKKIEPHLKNQTEFEIDKKCILSIIKVLEEFVKGY